MRGHVYSWEEVSWITGFPISDLLALFAEMSATQGKKGISLMGISQENLDELTATESELCSLAKGASRGWAQPPRSLRVAVNTVRLCKSA